MLLRQALAVARDAAAQAATLTRHLVGEDFDRRRKPDGSWVSDVDLAVEALLVDALRAAFPNHRILAEERGAQDGAPGTPFTWVLDPIDGTTSLVHGVPLFGTLLALQHAGDDGARSAVGVLSLPLLGRLYHAADGLGAWRDGQHLHLSDVTDDAPGLLVLGDRGQFERSGQPALFDAAMQHSAAPDGPVTRTYCDAFGHALVLDGSAAAMLDVDLRPWDLAATEVLLREAGGTLVRVGERPGRDGLPHTDVLFGAPAAVAAWQRSLGLS